MALTNQGWIGLTTVGIALAVIFLPLFPNMPALLLSTLIGVDLLILAFTRPHP